MMNKIQLTTISILLSTSSVQAEVLDIKQFNLDDYKGKVVYLDFWASWCKPCKVSFPWMNKINTAYAGQNFEVVTINLDEDSNSMLKFLETEPTNFDIFHDPSGTFAKQFQLKGMPTSYLLNKEGRLIKSHIGFYKKKIDQYEREIEALL